MVDFVSIDPSKCIVGYGRKFIGMGCSWRVFGLCCVDVWRNCSFGTEVLVLDYCSFIWCFLEHDMGNLYGHELEHVVLYGNGSSHVQRQGYFTRQIQE